MYKNILFALIVVGGLHGCGGGADQSAKPQEQPSVVTPTPQEEVIEDIQCDVNYQLPISSVYPEASSTKLSALLDRNKTQSSSWRATDVDTSLIVELEAPAKLNQLVITWKNTDVSHAFSVLSSKNKTDWSLLVNQGLSQKYSLQPEVISLIDMNAYTGRYLTLDLAGTDLSQPSELLEIEVFGCEQEVSHGIELIDWYLSVPTDEDNSGTSDSVKETDLAAGYFDSRFFSLSKDGGLTFTTSVSGYKTSKNTQYVRSELREMLRRGNTSEKTQGVNKNNWVFSTAPQSDVVNAGGIDGELYAELAVNHVTTTGEAYQVGRVIIGQIHANDDEPVRLYYRKLPQNTHGSIYIAHEILGGDDIYYELIGSRSNTASNPEQGISLNEQFSYSITVEGNQLTVRITKADGRAFSQIIDMSASGYDQGGQYMYFKAGVYNQNNSGDPHDYVQATFYQIANSHTGYIHSN